MATRGVHIKIQDLTHRYTARSPLTFQRVDVEADPGEALVIIGRSGCGKSTLLHLLGGLDSPSGGTVVLAGESLAELSERQATLARRHNIGFVFQFFNLIHTLTVAENIALPLELLGENKTSARQRADELLVAVGLTDMGQRFPETLSGGEQQRAAIARALAHSPALLLADGADQRIVIVAADGAFQAQLRSRDDAFLSLQLLEYDEDTKHLFVVAGNRLYVLALDSVLP